MKSTFRRSLCFQSFQLNGNIDTLDGDLDTFIAKFTRSTAMLPVSAYQSRVDGIAGGYMRIGNLVFVSIIARTATAISNAGAIITGFPKPYSVNLPLVGVEHTGYTNFEAFLNSNGNLDYFSLGSDAGVDTITTSQISHTLYSSRKFSDYKFICATIEDTYRRAFMMVPSNIFITSSLPLSLSYVDSVGTQYWAELRYVSDTSYSLVGSANANGKKLRLYGFIKK